MIYHVLPGDSLVGEFKKAKIDGEMIVCRECLIVGPVEAESLDQFWDERGRFIFSEYGEDEIVYHERVADELTKLTELTANDEVCLWFEYELFCSVNMWFCLWLLSETDARIFRVEPVGLSEDDRWKGFGNLGADDLQGSFEKRVEFSREDINLGARLWNGYRKNDHSTLKRLSATASNCFPYLNEVCEAAIEIDVKPGKILSAIKEEGLSDFKDIFPEFLKRAGVYGFGDSQVQRILERQSLA